MKRWIVVVLVLLALVVLVSPGLIGHLAEKSIEENIDWAERENPEVSVETESFERGWFTSAGRYRMVFSGGAFREAGTQYSAQLPALVIDTRIDHGLVPVTSLSRSAGTLSPGLASTVSTFQADAGDGQLTELPGTLYSNVGVTGSTDSRFLLDSGSFTSAAFSAEWQGADLRFTTDPSSGSITVDGSTRPFSISQNGETVELGEISVNLDQVRSDFDLHVGSLDVQMGAVQVRGAAESFSINGMSITADSSIDDASVSAATTIALESMSIPNFGDLDLNLDASAEGLDAASLSAIVAEIERAQAAPDPDLAMQGLYPQIESDVETLVSKGGSLRFDQLDFSLLQGTLETKIDLRFGELDEGDKFSWASVLLALTADIDIRIPVELYEFAQMLNPEAGSLVAMGMLVREGDYYIMDAEYAQGLMNVNGAPMPVPMPGM